MGIDYSGYFLEGFNEAFFGDIEKRTEKYESTLQDLRAKAQARVKGLAERRAKLGTYKEIAGSLSRDLEMTDAEILQLSSVMPLEQAYETINKEMARYRDAGYNLTKDKVLSMMQLPEGFKMPEGMTLEKGLRTVLGLDFDHLSQAQQNGFDPKSEGVQQSSWRRALGKFIMSDPRGMAAEELANMTIGGYKGSELMAFDPYAAAGKPLQGITRTRETLFENVDYDYEKNFGKTSKEFVSYLSDRIESVDYNNDIVLNNLAQSEGGETIAAKKRQYTRVGEQFAELDRQLAFGASELGFGNYGVRNTMLRNLASNIDSLEEANLFEKAISSGFAIDYIKAKKGVITAQDFDNILAGKGLEESDMSAEDIAAQTNAALGKPGVIETVELPPMGGANESPAQAAVGPEAPTLPTDIAEDPTIVAEFESLPSEARVDVQKRISSISQARTPAETRSITRRIIRDAKAAQQSEQERLDQAALNLPGADQRALQQQVREETNIDAMKDYTYQEWREMTRAERADAGLPVKPLDLWAATDSIVTAKDYFKRPEDPRSDAEAAADDDAQIKQDIADAIAEQVMQEKPEFGSELDAAAYIDQWEQDNLVDYNLSEEEKQRLAKALYENAGK